MNDEETMKWVLERIHARLEEEVRRSGTAKQECDRLAVSDPDGSREAMIDWTLYGGAAGALGALYGELSGWTEEEGMAYAGNLMEVRQRALEAEE